MIYVLRTDGTVIDIKDTPGEPTLAQLYEWIGHTCDTIERVVVMVPGEIRDRSVRAITEADMVIDEEGKLKELPINDTATQLFHLSHHTHDWIVGNAVILTEENRLT